MAKEISLNTIQNFHLFANEVLTNQNNESFKISKLIKKYKINPYYKQSLINLNYIDENNKFDFIPTEYICKEIIVEIKRLASEYQANRQKSKNTEKVCKDLPKKIKPKFSVLQPPIISKPNINSDIKSELIKKLLDQYGKTGHDILITFTFEEVKILFPKEKNKDGWYLLANGKFMIPLYFIHKKLKNEKI